MCNQNGWTFGDTEHVVTSMLRGLGYMTTEVHDGPVDLDHTGAVWMMGNGRWFVKLREQLAGQPPGRRPFTLVWHYEPLPYTRRMAVPWPLPGMKELANLLARRWNLNDVYTNYVCLRRLVRHRLVDLVVVARQGACDFLGSQGLDAAFVPLGYCELYGRDLGLARDIDVLFLDHLAFARRRRAVARLRRAGIDLQVHGSPSPVWGPPRTRLLNRAKIFLNIHRVPGDLNGLRMILGMANRALVISEPIYAPTPYVPGQHYVSATLRDMPDVIRYYLSHDEERDAIAAEGHRLVTRDVTMAHAISRLLDLMGRVSRGRPG